MDKLKASLTTILRLLTLRPKKVMKRFWGADHYQHYFDEYLVERSVNTGAQTEIYSIWQMKFSIRENTICAELHNVWEYVAPLPHDEAYSKAWRWWKDNHEKLLLKLKYGTTCSAGEVKWREYLPWQAGKLLTLLRVKFK